MTIRKKLSTKALAAALCAALLPVTASAEESSGLNVGPFRAIPTVGVTFRHESNVFNSATAEVDSFVTSISPGIRLERGDETSGMILGYEAEIVRYADTSSENAETHNAYINLRYSPTGRLRFQGDAVFARGSDRRGAEGAQQGQFVDLTRDRDEYDRSDLRASVEYGAAGARASIGANVGLSDLSYNNNRDFARFRDSEETTLGVDFGWRIASKTRLTLGAAQRDIEYDELRRLRGPGTQSALVSFDSQERDLMAGLAFDATSKLSGKLGFGRIEKDFNEPSFQDFSGSGWSIGLSYRPVSYSAFDLSSSRSAVESDIVLPLLGSVPTFAVARDITLAWTHSWSERFNSAVDVGLARTSYRSAADDGLELRDDDLQFFGLGFDYRFRRWLQVGASYRSYDRDSGSSAFDYQRDEFTLSFEATL